MGGDDRGEVGFAQCLLQVDGLQAQFRQGRDMRVVVGDLAAEVEQLLGDLQRGRLADVADPGLVANAEDQDPASR